MPLQKEYSKPSVTEARPRASEEPRTCLPCVPMALPT